MTMKYINQIFCTTSEKMVDIPDESVDLMVTSPPYNIDIKFGNKWDKRKIIHSKGVKYEDALSEKKYLKLLENVFLETQRVLKPNGTIIWVLVFVTLMS